MRKICKIIFVCLLLYNTLVFAHIGEFDAPEPSHWIIQRPVPIGPVDLFSGITAGIIVVDNFSVKRTTDVTITPPTIFRQRETTEIDFADNFTNINGIFGGGINVGLGFLAHDPLNCGTPVRFYFGLYGSAIWGDLDENETRPIALPVISELLMEPVVGVVSTKTEIDNIYELGMELGILITPPLLGFIKVGGVWAGIDLDASFQVISADAGCFNGTAEFSESNSFTPGLELGAGFSWSLSPNWIFTVEYMYRNFRSVKGNSRDVIFRPEDVVDGDIFPLINVEATTDVIMQSIDGIISYRYGCFLQ